MATGFTNDPNRDPKFRKKWKIRLSLSPAKWGDEEAETTVVIDLTDEAGDGTKAEVVLNVNDVEFDLETNDHGRASKHVTRLRLGENKFKAQLKGMPAVHDTADLDVEPKLTTTASEPVLGDDGMESTVNVMAELAFRPIKNADVQLILDGKKYGGPVATEDDGRVEIKVKSLAKGDHRVHAELVGTTIRSKSVTIAVKEEKIETPTDLKVYAHPQTYAEEYLISCEVFGEKKRGLAGVELEVKETAQDGKAASRVVRTGPSGAHRFNVRPHGSVEIFISVVGTNLDYTLRLPGPRRRVSSPPKYQEPEPSPHELKTGSVWDAFLSGFQRGRDALAKQRKEKESKS